MSTISNSDDIIDSRDVIQRIEELETEREECAETDRDDLGEERTDLATWNFEYGAELAALKALAAECEGYGDWEDGETLIRDSYFKEYAQDLAGDTGAIPGDASWPMTCIDWDQAASELQQDYTSVEFDGVTYWMRS